MNVIICDKCDGNGEHLSFSGADNPEIIKCNRCNGTGRLLVKTYTLKVPFDFDDIKLNKLDGEIIKLLINKDTIV